MKKTFLFVAILTAMAAATPPAVHAQTELAGSTGGGAYYKIVVPDAWNGELVIWNHGFDLAPPRANPDLGPLAQLQLSEGYAVAASSYQQSGWALFKTRNDLQHLYDVFVSNFGMPDKLFLTGGSLGGIVTAQAIEEAHLGTVDGALMICGALAGSRNWDVALDLRLLYDAVCAEVPAAAIPGGAEGLPPNYQFTQTDLALAVNACTGILLDPSLRTAQQSQNLAKILGVMQVPENFLLTDMAYATFAMSDLVHDPEKLAGKIGTGNVGVDYGDASTNASIQRVSPNPGASNRLGRRFTPSGNVGPAKIVTLHTDKDGLVVVENESAYASVVPAMNLTTAIVVEQTPTHCGFTPAEVAAGWEALRAWVGGAPRPTAAFIQGTCQSLPPAVFTGPCRIDPAFAIPDMDGRVRPR